MIQSLIVDILVVGGIGALLALFLELAGRFISNYGECRLRINRKKELVVQGGSPLLFSLMENGIFIPSACGGKGTCAYCKVKVLEGGGPVLPTETPYLTPEELEDHVRLSCQVKVRNDLSIEIPEDLFLIREFKAKVERIADLTHQIKGLKLRLPDSEEDFTFKPGQYVQMEVPKFKLSSQPEYRAFSIASPPQEHGTIELFIGRVEKGIVSTYVHDYLKKGQEVTLRGPFGDFSYRETDRSMLMIATGTGLAPILSILRHMRNENIQRPATLFFGTRYKRDLYCMEELRRLEKELPSFSLIATLSRETEESGWKGERGRVTGLIERRISAGENLDVYICGNADMVESCLDLLKKKEIPEDRIYFDKFT
jgi:Na+-transporting NADH:ubiquinone oxidoreductase subunit F